MYIFPKLSIEKTLDQLFPWLANKKLGVENERIEKVEKQLNLKLPEPLRKLYLQVGNAKRVMSTYNHIYAPEELEIYDNKLLFAQDIYGEYIWGIDLDDQTAVYVLSLDDKLWIEEEAPLESFVNLLIYDQCIRMGYKYCGIIGLSDEKLYYILEEEWEKVIEYKGLHVYQQEGALIWSVESGVEYMPTDIYFSTFSDEMYYLNEIRYELSEV